jgi:hypothetical protein
MCVIDAHERHVPGEEVLFRGVVWCAAITRACAMVGLPAASPVMTGMLGVAH